MDDRSYETPNRTKRARELRIEPRLGLGSPRRESSPRAREGNCCAREGLRARREGFRQMASGVGLLSISSEISGIAHLPF